MGFILHHQHRLKASKLLAFISLVLLAVCFLNTPHAFSQITKTARITLNEKSQKFYFGEHIYVTQDADKSLAAQVIFNRYQSNLRGDRQTSKLINLGINEPHSWLGVSVTNNSDVEDWVLDFGRLADGRYSRVKSLSITNMMTGKRYDLDRQSNQGAVGSAIRLALKPKSNQFLVISYEQEGGFANTIAPYFMSEENFLKSLQYGDFKGRAIALLFVFALGFFITFVIAKRSVEAAAIAGYVFVFGVLYFLIDVSFLSAYLSHAATSITICATGVLGCLFASKLYLDIKGQDFTESIMIYGLCGFIALCVCGAIFAADTSSIFDDSLIFASLTLSLAAICALSFSTAQRGQVDAYYYCIGFAALFAGILLSGLSAGGAIASNWLFINGFWIALLLHCGFVGYALMVKERVEASHRALLLSRERRASHSAERLQQSKENADQARLLRVIERERELMSELREREIKRTEEMRKSKDQADEANRAKSAFLAVVSHEIRTPMTGIMGMVRLLLDTKMNKEQHDYAQAILNSGDSMMALLNDILDFEKIESGNMDLEMIEFDLPQLVQSVVTLMSGHAAEKKISLEADIHADFPVSLVGDPTRLRQILLNLVNNAIKFTSDGGVKIILKASPVGEAQSNESKHYQEIYFGVQDTGIGISEEAQADLFVPFSQAEASTTRKYGGTGLGLAICRRLVEAMRGELRVESVPNEGSTFYFKLVMAENKEDERRNSSYKSESDDAPEEARREAVPAMRILIVDDNEMNRRVLEGFLKKDQHDLTMAENGEEALKAIEQQNFDAVLCDIEMDGMNGVETTRAIRRLADKERAATPVFALTGNVGEGDIERYYAANMNGFLAKPIDPVAVNRALKRVIDNDLEQAIILPDIHAVEAELGVDTSGLRLNDDENFLLDDENEGENEDIEAVEEDSVAPIHLFLNQAHEENTHEDFDSFSIVDDEDEKEDEDENEETLEEPAPIADDTTSDDDTPIIDQKMVGDLKSSLGEESFKSLLDGFFEKVDELVAALVALEDSGDAESIRARSHELKGMAANFGFSELAAISKIAEDSSKAGDLGAAVEAIKKLPDAHRRAEKAI